MRFSPIELHKQTHIHTHAHLYNYHRQEYVEQTHKHVNILTHSLIYIYIHAYARDNKVKMLAANRCGYVDHGEEHSPMRVIADHNARVLAGMQKKRGKEVGWGCKRERVCVGANQGPMV